MTDTRISATDLLRLAAIASVSPEGTAEEVLAILQRTGQADAAPTAEAGRTEQGAADDGADKLAKPE